MLVAGALQAQSLELSRLDDDPLPVQVLAGDYDDRFVPAGDLAVRERSRSPRWWRLTARSGYPAAGQPQLVLRTPHLNRVEVWQPQSPLPVPRALVGAGIDRTTSTRALVVPLPGGLAAGQSVYLRVQALTPLPMTAAIEPLAVVHRKDMAHVAWRTAVLTTMAVVAVLALGFWAGLGERSYLLLCLTLIAQLLYLVCYGGEARAIPGLAELVGNDPRAGRMFGLIAVLASNGFLAHYLSLRQTQPKLMRVLTACNLLVAALMLVTLTTVAPLVAVAANVVLMVGLSIVMTAGVIGAWRRQREALFLLLSWTPMFALTALRMAGLVGWWGNPEWMDYAFPVGFALGGLVLMIGLSDKLQQLRRDRDQASRQATYDALTGAMTRPAIEARLKAAVESAHKSRRPLSVVFFDVDHFKRINDEHGHLVGDQTLRIIALRTRNRLRTYDLFGRYGGDEILVVLPDTQLREALGVAENLRSSVNCRPLSIDGRLLAASLSVGVAELMHEETAEHLLERADAALYASKSGGRDRVTGHQASRAKELVH
ncbi:diguanylate cyclase [Lysobacter silvisoli]|uniref:diguanylate cyclase n=1 Tax=Lysobacter silvisoli TaxID=2293254 RepID=A0A371K274_9GAMM|nr:diguanylate cyclase [Lysobacter silvisoli]RDZ28021.1 GGDEF domain-containing protein [Lysobacter silvisoli]